MLGTDKSRGYCLEMICADFLAGAHLDNGNPEVLLNSISRYYKFLPGEQKQAFLENLRVYQSPRMVALIWFGKSWQKIRYRTFSKLNTGETRSAPSLVQVAHGMNPCVRA